MKPSEIVRELKSLKFRSDIIIPTDLYGLFNEAANLIESLIPKPISEAPRDGTHFIGLNLTGGASVFHYFTDGKLYLSWNKNADDADFNTQFVTHFIPLSSIQKLMEGGE